MLYVVHRWWKDEGLADNCCMTREEREDGFFRTIGMAYDPQFNKSKKEVTKAFTLITVLDDISDVYGSLDELEQFTDAIVRYVIKY